MKKLLQTSTKLLIALCSVALIAACSSSSNKSYSLMPKECAAIGEFNAVELFENLGTHYSEELKGELEKELKKNKIPVELLATNQPIYLATSNEGVGYIAVEYPSKEQVETIKTQLLPLLEKAELTKAEVAGYELYYNEMVGISYTPSGIFAIFTDKTYNRQVKRADNFILTHFEELAEGKLGSITDNKLFDKVTKSEGVLAFSLQNIDGYIRGFQNVQDLGISEEELEQLKDKEIFLELLLEQNSLKLVVENNMEQGNIPFTEISGTFNESISKNSALHFATSVKGVEGLEAMVNQLLPLMQMLGVKNMDREVEEMISNSAAVIESMNGDFVLNIADCDLTIPNIVLGFEVKDRTALETIAKYANEFSRFIKINEVKKDNFKIATPIVNLYYGQSDNIFYITNSSASADAIQGIESMENNFSSTELAKDIEGSIGAIVLDAQEVQEHPTVQQQLRRINDNPLLKDLQKVELLIKSLNLAEINIELEDSKTPALERIITGVDKLNNRR